MLARLLQVRLFEIWPSLSSKRDQHHSISKVRFEYRLRIAAKIRIETSQRYRNRVQIKIPLWNRMMSISRAKLSK